MLNTIKKLFITKTRQDESIIDTQNNIDESKQVDKDNQSQSINPFLNNKIHLDYHLQKMATENKSLKIQRIVLAVLLLSSIGGLVYLGGQTKKEVIVTMVDEKGQRIQPINLKEMKDTDQRNRIIFKIIEDSLLNIRTVTPDKNLQYELSKKALVNMRKGSQAYQLIVNSLKETNPNSPYITGQTYMVTPIIKSTLAQNITFTGETTKRANLVIEWRERVNKLDGTYVQTNEYKGNFIFDILPPQTEEEIRQNPFGIQIHTIQMIPIRIVDKANDTQPLNNSTATQGAGNAQ